MLHKEFNQIEIEEVFKTFSHTSYWKLFIDTVYWNEQNAKKLFDQQYSPGYLVNTTKAFLYLLYTINDPVTVDSIISLHDLAYHEKTANVLGLKSFGMSRIKRDALTKEGLIEAIEKAKRSDGKLILQQVIKHKTREEEVFTIDLNQKSSDILASEILSSLDSRTTQEVILGRMSSEYDAITECQRLLDEYQREIKFALDNKREKLTAIVRLIQSLHQYHPFNDGNGRTFIFLLLNKLLMQNGLSPTIVEMPGRFSGYSVDQLVKEVILGQDRFESLCDTENNEQSFLSFLNEQVENGEEIITYIENEIYRLYQDYDIDSEAQDFVQENLDYLYHEKMTKVYDPETIRLVFNKTPPTGSDFSDLFNQGLRTSNFTFVDCLIEHCRKELPDIEILKSPTTLMPLFNYFRLEQIQILLRNDKLNLNSQDSFNILSCPLAIGSTGTHFFLRNLLVDGKQSILLYMLQRCPDDKLFSDLMSLDMRGINALQLIGLFGDRELFEYCSKRLNVVDKKKTIELVQTPITTQYKQEIGKLTEFNLADLLENQLSISDESPSRKMKHKYKLGLYPSAEKTKEEKATSMKITPNVSGKKLSS